MPEHRYVRLFWDSGVPEDGAAGQADDDPNVGEGVSVGVGVLVGVLVGVSVGVVVFVRVCVGVAVGGIEVLVGKGESDGLIAVAVG